MAEHAPSVIVLTDWRRTGGRGVHRHLRHSARGAPFVMVCDGGVSEWDDRFAQVLQYPLEREVLLQGVRTAIDARVVARLGTDRRLLLRSRTLSWGRENIELTRLQECLLRELVVAGGSFVTPDSLMQAVWGPEAGDDRRGLYTHLSWLRRKLAMLGDGPRIESVRGKGYRLVVPPPAADDAYRADG